MSHYLTDTTSGEHFSCHTTDPPNTNHSHCKCPDFLLKYEGGCTLFTILNLVMKESLTGNVYYW